MVFQSFARLIQTHQLVRRGDKVLLALSGGADSTALLCLFLEIRARLGLQLAVAHLNHQFRGEESEADQAFVQSLASGYDLPCVVERVHSSDISKCGNQEAWAREQRYGFLQRVGDSIGARRIALGHTQNDQAETVLLRLLRGSGSLGLAAMTVSRDERFIRPLLSIKRADLQTYLRSRDVPWREDSSNRDLKFARNRLRHELIPWLEESFNPRIVEVLAGTAESLRGDVETLNWLVAQLAGRESGGAAGPVAWPRSWLKTLPLGLRRNLVRHAFRLMDPGRSLLKRHVEAVLELLEDHKSGKSLRLGRIEVMREFDRLIFREISHFQYTTPYCYPLGIPGQVELREAGSVFETHLHEGSICRELMDRWELYLSPQAAAQGLEVRSWRAGDAYQPLGSSRPKKIKELFLRKRIGFTLRSGWPVVTFGGKIICVRGFPVAADSDLHRPTGADMKVVIEERVIESDGDKAALL